jgi:hypothetical protein
MRYPRAEKDKGSVRSPRQFLAIPSDLVAVFAATRNRRARVCVQLAPRVVIPEARLTIGSRIENTQQWLVSGCRRPIEILRGQRQVAPVQLPLAPVVTHAGRVDGVAVSAH